MLIIQRVLWIRAYRSWLLLERVALYPTLLVHVYEIAFLTEIVILFLLFYLYMLLLFCDRKQRFLDVRHFSVCLEGLLVLAEGMRDAHSREIVDKVLVLRATVRRVSLLHSLLDDLCMLLMAEDV